MLDLGSVGPEVHGIDSSQDMLNICQQKTKAALGRIHNHLLPGGAILISQKRTNSRRRFDNRRSLNRPERRPHPANRLDNSALHTPVCWRTNYTGAPVLDDAANFTIIARSSNKRPINQISKRRD